MNMTCAPTLRCNSFSAGRAFPKALASPIAKDDLKIRSSVSSFAKRTELTLSTMLLIVANRITFSWGGKRLPAWLIRSTISWLTSPTRMEFRICLNSGSRCLKISTSSNISMRSEPHTLASKNHCDL